MELRPYQVEAVDAVIKKFGDGINRQILVLPTGTGKTIVFCEIAKQLDTPFLVLAHRDELIKQAVDKLSDVHNWNDIGIVKAGMNEIDKKITVASVQTLARKNRLAQIREDIGLIITDEAHHAAAVSYKRIYHRYGLMEKSKDDEPLPVISQSCQHLGVTATPMRNDRLGLREVFDKIAYRKPYIDFVKDGYLCDLDIRGIRTGLDLSAVKTTKLTGYGDDFQSDSLSEVVDTDEVASDIFNAYREHAGDRTRTLAFCVDRKHAKNLHSIFIEGGINAGYVDGETHPVIRTQTLTDFEEAKINVLFNIQVLTEGYDCPPIDCILLARPSKSESFLTQMIGRGTRIAEGKKNCLVLDVAHTHRVKNEKHAGSIIDIASLFKPEEELKKDKPKGIGTGPGGGGRSGEHFIGEETIVNSILELFTGYSPQTPWERDPPTEKQIGMIRWKAPKTLLNEINLETITKGQASHLINLLTKDDEKKEREDGPNTCPECHQYKKEGYALCYPCNQKSRRRGINADKNV